MSDGGPPDLSCPGFKGSDKGKRSHVPLGEPRTQSESRGPSPDVFSHRVRSIVLSRVVFGQGKQKFHDLCRPTEGVTSE